MEVLRWIARKGFAPVTDEPPAPGVKDRSRQVIDFHERVAGTVHAADVSARFVQSLVAFASGGISPVQVTVIVCPTAEGTVIVLVGGLDAQLNKPREPPTAKRATVKMRRGLMTPDLEADFVRIVFGSFPELEWTGMTVNSEMPGDWMLTFP